MVKSLVFKLNILNVFKHVLEFIIVTKLDQKQTLYSFKAKNEHEKRKILRIVQHQIIMKRISLENHGIWSAENICEGLDVYYNLILEKDVNPTLVISFIL